jgi:hypothetical protein
MGIFKWKKEELFEQTMREAMQLAAKEEEKLGRALTSEELYDIYTIATAHYELSAKRPRLKPAGIYILAVVVSIGTWIIYGWLCQLIMHPGR